jgi:serine/threonine protein kinase
MPPSGPSDRPDTLADRATLPPSDAAPGNGRDLEMWVAPHPNDHSSRETDPWPPKGRPVTPGPVAEVSDFGPYELLGEIGRGGMGVVYKARQKGLDRIVAVKMILASHLASAEQVSRFYDEARAAAKLQDPRVVSIHDVGQIHGQHYFAMEHVAGPSLAQLARGGPIDPTLAARLVLEVARAVGRLHRQGVVHRDLKPSNILLDEAGRPCITDFGLAKMLTAEGSATRSGAIVGTPSYMAPEQAAGRGGVGPLSDVYSLGAILYELLTGRPPFDEDNPLDTLVQVLESEPTAPGHLRDGLPRALEMICLRCLEKSRGQRYVSADALADDLERFLQGEPVEARRLPPVQRAIRWARREPALVSRLATLAGCALATQLDQLVTHALKPDLNRRLVIVITLGAAASVMFQALLKRERWASLVRYAWSTADMILFSTLVLFSDALTTPLIAGYLLLVAASGLWFRERLVGYTTVLAMISYLALAGVDRFTERGGPPVVHAVLFLLGLGVAGFVVAYQVRRVRALSAFYEHRPLP